MKRLWRWIFNAFTILLALLALASAGLWVRSYWKTEVITRAASSSMVYVNAMPPIESVCIQWERGQLECKVQREEHSPIMMFGYGPFEWRWDDITWLYDVGMLRPFVRRGFGCVYNSYDALSVWEPRWSLDVWVPLWFLTLLFGSIPGVRGIILIRRRRKHPPGHCQRCGYDLRATPNRCPECGTPATPEERAEAQAFEASPITP